MWRSIPVPTKEHLRNIQFVEGSGWIAGYGGTVLHSSDGGGAWSLQNTGTSLSLESVFFLNAKQGWSVGWNGGILRTTDGGLRGDQVRSPAAMWSLSHVYFRDAQTGWAVGRLGQLLRSRDGGLSWEAQPTPVNNSFSFVFFDNADRGWITGENTILMSEDGGESCQAQDLGVWAFLERMVPVNESLWAVGPFGILKRDRRETAWRSVDTLR